MKSRQEREETAKRMWRRMQETPPAPYVPVPLPPPTVSLDEVAASGQLCRATDHYWDRVEGFDHVWKCRRCGGLTRTEHP